MVQHRFWAIAFSLNKLLLYTASLVIIAIIIAINIDSLQYFLYMCIGIMFVLLTVIFFVVKRVSLTIKDSAISIKMNGQKRFTSDIENLKYIRGANIHLPQSQGEINMVFNQKIITFSIFDMRGLNKNATSKHIDILNSLIDAYNLEDKGRDKKHLSKMHIYWNHRHKQIKKQQ